MNRYWAAVLSLLVGAAGSSSAVPLQFTNISPALLPGLTNRLTAVTYGGNTNFVAVGEQGTYVRGVFTPNEPFLALVNWTSGPVGTSGSNLLAVAASGTNFVASGDNNRVFSSADGGTWGTNHSIFNNTARAAGLAYNGGNFVGVAKAPQIAWQTPPLPNSTTWQQSTIAELSFVESYRAVTPYGATGFAVSGIFGVVRVSTDRGATWGEGFSLGGISQPDLLGIATAGSQTFVCVGAANPTAPGGTNGVILVSTNNGVNWVTAYTNSSTGTPLNSVAFLNPGFIAAGRNGAILTSDDGVHNWTIVPASAWRGAAAPTQDLCSVTFATSGYMKEVGVLVGAQGTVVLSGLPPPPPVSLGNKLWCAGYPNPPLVVSVTNSVGTNLVTVDWFDAASGGTRLTNTSVSYTAPTQIANENSTNTYWAEARDLRTGFVSTNRTPVTLTIHQRPTAEIISTNSICNGETSVVTVKFKTGNPPWNLTFTDGVSNYIVAANSPTLNYTNSFIVYPTNQFLNEATNWIYRLTRLTDTFCEADTNAFPADLTGRGQVTVYPRPTSVVSGTPSICNGDSTVLSAALTGIGPWNVTWSSNGVVVATHNGVAGPTDTLTVSPANPNLNTPLAHTYTVTALSDAHCTANTGDMTGNALVTVNPRPTAAVSGDATICNGSSTVVSAALTGIGPWNVTWSSNGVVVATHNGVAGPTDTLTVSPVNPNPSTPLAHTYTVSALSDAHCTANAGDMTGGAVITVNPRPASVVGGTPSICNGDSTVLSAALTGIGPWNVTWSSNGVVVATHNGVAGPTDTLTVSPVNPNPSTPLAHTYTVTALSDAHCTANAGDMTGNAVVTVNPRPKAAVSGTPSICNGDSTVLNAALTGIGPWNVTWSSNGVVVATHNGVAGPTDTLTVSPVNPNPSTPLAHTYTVTALSDAHCTANAGDMTGNAVVTVNPRPKAAVSGTLSICKGDSTVLSAALTGIGPWNVTWSSNGVVVATHNGVAGPTDTLTVSPVNPNLNTPLAHTYTATALSDAHCTANAGDMTGNAVVTVNPRPKAEVSGDTNICNGSSAVLRVALTGIGTKTIMWSDGFNDSTNGATAWRIVSPFNTYVDVPTNFVYTVTNVTDANCTAQPGDITGSASVTVYPRPTATLTSDTNFCTYGITALHAELTGVGPWTNVWTVLSNGVTSYITNVVATSYDDLVVALTNTSSFGLISNRYTVTVTDAASTNGCTPFESAAVVVKVYPSLSADVTSPDEGIGLSQTKLLSADLTGTAPWIVNWSDGFQTSVSTSPATRLVTGNYITNTLHTDDFIFSVTNLTDGSSNLCGATLTGSTEVTLTLTGIVAFVSGNASICGSNCTYVQLTLYQWTNAAHTDRVYGSPWIVTWSDGVKLTNGLPGSYNPELATNRHVCLATTTTYSVTNVVGTRQGSASSHLTSTRSGSSLAGSATITVSPLPTAQVTTTNHVICLGDSIAIGIYLTGQSPWVVTWSDGVTVTNAATNAVYIAAPTSNFTYTVTSVTDSTGCGGTSLTGSAAVTVTNCAPLAIALGTNVPPTNAVLSWGGNRWLLSAPTFTDPWTNIIQGTLWTTNYWTNPISASQEFFRLGAPTNGP